MTNLHRAVFQTLACVALTLALLVPLRAQVTEIEAFIGTASESFESFDNYLVGYVGRGFIPDERRPEVYVGGSPLTAW